MELDFDSIDASKCMIKENFKKTNILPGHQKLLLKAVGSLSKVPMPCHSLVGAGEGTGVLTQPINTTGCTGASLLGNQLGFLIQVIMSPCETGLIIVLSWQIVFYPFEEYGPVAVLKDRLKL
jgi:hypothetical protein